MLEYTDATLTIRVVGIVGTGCHIVESFLFKDAIDGESCMLMDTDEQTLEAAACHQNFLLHKKQSDDGHLAFDGFEAGRRAALECQGRIAEALDGADLVLIVAGMGGSTATGAAPVIAQIAREMNILTVCAVTMPFPLEGRKRSACAAQGIEALLSAADSVIAFKNEQICVQDNENKPAFSTSLVKVNDTVVDLVRFFLSYVETPGLICLCYDDLWRALSGAGLTYFIAEKISMATDDLLLEAENMTDRILKKIQFAKIHQVILHLEVPEYISISQTETIYNACCRALDEDSTVIMGVHSNESLDLSANVRLLVTGKGYGEKPDIQK